MCDPILVTLYNRQSSRENATPSSGTSPLASYKEVPSPTPLPRFSPAFAMPALQRDELVFRLVRISVTSFPPLPSKVGLILAWLLHRSRQGRWGPCILPVGPGTSPTQGVIGASSGYIYKILKSDWLLAGFQCLAIQNRSK